MHDNGFIRVGAAAPKVFTGNVAANLAAITDTLDALASSNVGIAVLPELCLTGYTCGDLFHNGQLLENARQGLTTLAQWSAGHPGMAFVAGTPLRIGGALYNCAVVYYAGEPKMVVPKTFIPNYNEFYERRWFAPWQPGESSLIEIGGTQVKVATGQPVCVHGINLGVEICEDLWVPEPPSGRLALAGAEVIVNLSASPDIIGKRAYLRSLVLNQSARTIAAYAYASAGFGESSTDLVFDGKAMIAENGTMLAETRSWSYPGPVMAIADVDIEALRRDRMHNTSWAEARRLSGVSIVEPTADTQAVIANDLQYRHVNPTPFVPHTDSALEDRSAEVVNIQATGLAQRLNSIGCKTAVVGISGGLDSTLALLVTVRAFDMLGLPRGGVIGVTMPGFGTTGRTHANAVALMTELGISQKEISIVPAVNQHFKDIGHDPAVHDVTYENSQARQRTLLLMDIANQAGGIVIGTGDLSELALGWATYNGDHMSMYGVNTGVPKTLVRHLVTYFANEAPSGSPLRKTLLDIVDTPVSPELLPAAPDGSIAQKTEDTVGPYILHDFFLYYTLRYGFAPERIYRLALKAFSRDEYSEDVIKKWLRVFVKRFFNQQFKRSCLPDGPKTGSVCLSPRGDWRMPSDISPQPWLKD